MMTLTFATSSDLMFVAVRAGRRTAAGRRCRHRSSGRARAVSDQHHRLPLGTAHRPRRHHHLGRDPPLTGTCAHPALAALANGLAQPWRRSACGLASAQGAPDLSYRRLELIRRRLHWQPLSVGGCRCSQPGGELAHEGHLQISQRRRQFGTKKRCGLLFDDRHNLTVGRVR
jgi:hypothetical protein